MSGTSLDGIDVAIVDVRGARVRTLGFTSTPYSRQVREQILAVSNTVTHTAAISRLSYRLAELYAREILSAVKQYGTVELIGCHGQTIYHEGRSNTLQIGEAAIIAERTGVPVINNFRARDIAAGGQGAPLVPFADYLLFRHPTRTRIALNIGGIANFSFLPAGCTPQDVIAFDTGPGNMVIDALASEYSEGKLSFDRDGKIAASGEVNIPLLKKLLADPYYRRKPPKSAGREQYGAEFIARLKSERLPMQDLIATVTALTAETIAIAVRRLPAAPAEIIVSGGGVHNPQIMNRLAELLPHTGVCRSTHFGVDTDAKEAVAFAIMAYETWRGRASNLPSATGARRPAVLGSITPGGA
jgi:anhydro-N-acetylmuramic acid kinase